MMLIAPTRMNVPTEDDLVGKGRRKGSSCCRNRYLKLLFDAGGPMAFEGVNGVGWLITGEKGRGLRDAWL